MRISDWSSDVGSSDLPAGDVGRDQRTGFVILELVDAAFAAAVAQRLPLSAIELFDRHVFPEARAHFAQRSISSTIGCGGPSTGSSASCLPSGLIRYAMRRSEEHTSELQSLMLIVYAVFFFKKKSKIPTYAI